MSISIHGSTGPQHAALESLTTQAGNAAGAGATSLLDATTPQAATSSSIIDVKGGTPQVAGLSSHLAVSASIADAAVAAGSTVESLLAQMRQDAATASNPGLDRDSRAALDAGFKASLIKIRAAVSAAGVDGTNLIDGSVSGAANTAASTLTGVDLSAGGPLIGLGADASLSDPATASQLATHLGAAIDKVGAAVEQISAQGQAIHGHLAVVAKAGLSLSPGVAKGLNTGLDADGARLAALQVQQQLSLSGAAVSNKTPNAILALFQAS